MAVVTDVPPSPAARFRGALVRGLIGDWGFRVLCAVAACVPLVLLGLIISVLFGESLPGLSEIGPTIVTGQTWRTSTEIASEPRVFGGASFIYGTIVTSALAMLIAVPLGVGSAAFLSEIAPPLVRRVGSFLIELLAAIPSVVYGFWGVNFLAPPLQSLFTAMGSHTNTGGKGLLASGLILAIMILPYVAAITYDVCQAVPSAQRQGSLALGATRWQTIWRVVIPYAQPGIIAGCFLALGRALGETMAVVMLVGNTAEIRPLPFGVGYTIPSLLANELTATESEAHYGALMVLALLLFAVTILMNIAARFFIWRMRSRRTVGPSWMQYALPAMLVLLCGWALLQASFDFGVGPGGTAGFFAGAVFVYWILFRLLLLGEQFVGAKRVNVLMTGVLGACLVVTCLPLFLILGYLVYRGVGGLSLELFTLDAIDDNRGLRNAFVGSFIIVGLASVIAIPVGLFAAIFLAEYRTRAFGSAVRFVGELLAGVPSIVVGVFVFGLVHFLIKDLHWLENKAQYSGWAGIAALAIMMVPIVLRSSEESLKLVPQTLRNASHALGAFHWQTVLRVSVPAATTAIITGVFLAIARIAGETAPLLMTALGNDNLKFSPSGPMGFVPLYIFRYAMEGRPDHEAKAWAAALVLVTFIMVLNVGVRVATGRRQVLASRAE
jgi:phosphate transport system permease protein